MEEAEAMADSMFFSLNEDGVGDVLANLKAAVGSPIKFTKIKNNIKEYIKNKLDIGIAEMDSARKRAAAHGEGDKDKNRERLDAALKAKKEAIKGKMQAVVDRMSQLADNEALKKYLAYAKTKADLVANQKLLKDAQKEENETLRVKYETAVGDAEDRLATAEDELKTYSAEAGPKDDIKVKVEDLQTKSDDLQKKLADEEGRTGKDSIDYKKMHVDKLKNDLELYNQKLALAKQEGKKEEDLKKTKETIADITKELGSHAGSTEKDLDTLKSKSNDAVKAYNDANKKDPKSPDAQKLKMPAYKANMDYLKAKIKSDKDSGKDSSSDEDHLKKVEDAYKVLQDKHNSVIFLLFVGVPY